MCRLDAAHRQAARVLRVQGLMARSVLREVVLRSLRRFQAFMELLEPVKVRQAAPFPRRLVWVFAKGLRTAPHPHLRCVQAQPSCQHSDSTTAIPLPDLPTMPRVPSEARSASAPDIMASQIDAESLGRAVTERPVVAALLLRASWCVKGGLSRITA
jgi:hypothetical protein